MTEQNPSLRIRNSLGLAMFAAGLMLFAAFTVHGQNDPTFLSAKLIIDRPIGEPFIALAFDRPFKLATEPQILDINSYRAVRINKGAALKDRFLGVDKVTLDPDEVAGPVGPQTVRLYLSTPLDIGDGDTITIYYVASMFNGTDLKAPILKGVTPAPTPSATVTRGGGSGLNLKKADGRDDAHLYFAGEINRASGTPFSGSIDLKFELPLPALRSARHELILPQLDLKASNDPEADPDTIKVGVESRLLVAQAGLEYSKDSPVLGVFWHNSAKIEGDRDFDNVNAIFGSKFLFPLKPVFLTPITRDRVFFALTPFVGFEGGKNLKSPVTEADGRGLARILVGSSIFARIYQGNESFARVTLDGVYERRWPLRAEIGFRTETIEVENGKDKEIVVPAFFGSRPRQWAELKLNYNFNEFFSSFVGYQYGELPPAYKLVDHAFRFGLVLKAKLK